MSKYLLQAKFTPEGTKGLHKEGGSNRKKYVEKFINELGGKVESFYYAFGEVDVFVIMDLPDAATAASLSFAINATEALHVSFTPLLAPEEIDQAIKKTVKYSPPGRG